MIYTTKSLKIRLLLTIAFIFLFLRTAKVESQNIIVLPEGYDFATQVLGDPWDMKEFTDISVGLNNGGQDIHLEQVRVENGVFKSVSVTNDPQFSPLWPMFYIGKVGDQYPIPNSYRCLYVALKVVADGNSTHNIQSFWFENEQLTNAKFGYTKFVNFPDNQWVLIKMDLVSDYFGGESWNNLTKWKGIRIDPTDKKDAFIDIDWVRLTDCKAVNAVFNVSTNSSIDFYLRRENREIFIGDNISPLNGRINVDFQGIEPGTYEYLIKNERGETLRTGEIQINQTPLVNINKPSPQTGPSIIWEMNSQSDILRVECLDNISFSNTGEIGFDTQSRVCESGGAADPKLYLNLPQPFISSSYRYLSYRLYTEWSKPWANVPEGMIVRWIWSTQGTSQRPGYRCHWVSQDLPFDVGWQIYTVDLFDPFLGSPEQKAGDCPLNKNWNWNEAGEILELRFDPNENITGETIRQKIDWIRLSGVERHKSGLVYPIYYSVIDENMDRVSHQFFYTNDLNQPFQNIAKEKQVSFPPPPRDSFSVYLPAISNNATLSNIEGNVYLWDTNGVTAGIYYICISSDDGLNQKISCSNAPIEIIP